MAKVVRGKKFGHLGHLPDDQGFCDPEHGRLAEGGQAPVFGHLRTEGAVVKAVHRNFPGTEVVV